MRIPKLLVSAIFVATIPIFLITSNVRWVINASFLYSYGFDKYNITISTGVERDELSSAARQIRDYFNNSEEFLAVRIVHQGFIVDNLYNEREILHMKDVKTLVTLVYRIQMIAGTYLIGFALIGMVLARRGFLSRLGRYISFGGLATLGLVSLLGLGALAGFDRLFLAFHLVSFSNDLWQLDPSRDYLIAMFPQGFFFDATMWIAGATIMEAVLLSFMPIGLLRWWQHQNI